MTDAEWNVSTDPDEMLVAAQGVATERQLRLWCCACVRRVWDRIADVEAGRLAVETAEAFARGTASSAELTQAHRAAQHARSRVHDLRVKDALDAASWCAAESIDALGVARFVGWGAAYAAVGQDDLERIA
jgi:hypothetical protein